jgi:hypothetical protein
VVGLGHAGMSAGQGFTRLGLAEVGLSGITAGQQGGQ